MTAMDILEALGQTREELLYDCDRVIAAAQEGKADVSPVPKRKRENKYRRAAAGLMAAVAVLLLVYVGSGAFISRSFDSSGSSGSSSMFSTSTTESEEISADTAAEESTAESETAEMEEEAAMETAADEAETGVQTESAMLETLPLAEVYISTFDTSSLSDSVDTEWMECADLIQEEIDAALAQEAYGTLPVYRFAQTEEAAGESAVDQSEKTEDTYLNLIEKLGDYPVITAEEAEKLLWQGYYLSSAGFSEDIADSAVAASVELQYLFSAKTQIYMPYYMFDVVVDGDMVSICCVPAISSEYLEGTLNGGGTE